MRAPGWWVAKGCGVRGVLMAVCAVVGLLPAPVAADDVRGVFDQMSPSVVVIRGRGRDVGINGRGLTYFTEIGSGVVVTAQGDVMTPPTSCRRWTKSRSSSRTGRS